MNTKLITLLMCSLFMGACSIGPTAMLADGSQVTLGGTLLSEGEADARQASMPNGLALNWIRTKYNETGVAKAGLGAWAFGKGVGAFQANTAVKEATKVTQGEQAIKQAGIASQTELGKAAIEAAPAGSVISVPGVSITPP